MPKITADDCRSCGACCASAEGGDVLAYGYADLTRADVEQLSRHTRRKIQESFVGGENRHMIPAKELPAGGATCMFLRGTPGSRCSCSIYASRPSVCREFNPGSHRCRAARADLTILVESMQATTTKKTPKKGTVP
jgi:Fe-S-cluster containining protein